ncbi:MAG: division/cell wall cluster transcriptional repressor MraZ [Alphaproteobacteria bacterium]
MALFVGTVVNKVDRKGRVSVPASFRAALAGQSFAGIVAFPSYKHKALECCAMDFMEQMSLSLQDIDTFSAQQDTLAATIFAEAHQLPFDSEGRILLPAPLLEHAGIGEMAAFVGQGPRFQIWQPEAREVFAASARERALRENMTLKVRPPKGLQGGSGGESGGGEP